MDSKTHDLRLDQIAEVTGVHPETLRRLARSGRLHGAYRLGKAWLVRREALDEIRGLSRCPESLVGEERGRR